MKKETKKNILSGLMMIGIVGLLIGCGSATSETVGVDSENTGNDTPLSSTYSISLSSTTINAGESITLTVVPPDADSYTIRYDVDNANGMTHSFYTIGKRLYSTQSGSGTEELVYTFTGAATPTMLIEILEDSEVVSSQNFSITVN